MGVMVSQITSPTIVYSTICAGADQRKHQSSASLAFVLGIHRRSVNAPHKWPVTRKMLPFDDVIMMGYCAVKMPTLLYRRMDEAIYQSIVDHITLHIGYHMCSKRDYAGLILLVEIYETTTLYGYVTTSEWKSGMQFSYMQLNNVCDYHILIKANFWRKKRLPGPSHPARVAQFILNTCYNLTTQEWNGYLFDSISATVGGLVE